MEFKKAINNQNNMKISQNFKDGKPKYSGLYEWQVENDFSDEDPMFALIAMVFAVVLALPEYSERLRQEDIRLLDAIRHERNAIETARASEQKNNYEIAGVGGLVGAASFTLFSLVLYYMFFR